MMTAHEWLAREATLWWPAIADHLWQSGLFMFVVLIASFALKNGPARIRYSFWLLASAKLIVPTTLFVWLLERIGLDATWLLSAVQRLQQHAFLLEGVTTPVATLTSTYDLTVYAGDPIRHNEIYCLFTAVWLGGCLALLSAWVWRRRKLHRALELGQRVQSGREWIAFQRARKSLDLRTDVELIISSDKTEPTVCGVLKPALLLPESVAEHLDDGELETIMLHELVHVMRRDNLIGNFQMAVCAVFWFYPPVWFVSRKLFDERELACDEKVLEVHAAPEEYAASILKVVRFCFGWRVAGLAGAGGGSNLRRRIENIMSTNKSSHTARIWTRRLAASLVGLTLMLMVAAGVYSRANNVHSTGAASEFHDATMNNGDINLASSIESDLKALVQKNKKGHKTPPPPPPPPSQDIQPSAPPQNMQPPAPPQRPSQMQPPPPPPPIALAATPDKSSEKGDESSQEKKDVRVKGKLIEAPRPEYPEEAKKQRVEGTVEVTITIGEEGKVIFARAKSGPSLLHDVSVAAAYKARFEPSTINGKPVKVAGIMSYDFKLDEN
jgi:bla regulator protein BlaR1